MNCIVLTPESELFSGSVSSVKVPGISGKFEILNNHAPIVSALTEGNISVKEDGGETHTFAIDQGFVEVINNEVSLMITLQSKEKNT